MDKKVTGMMAAPFTCYLVLCSFSCYNFPMTIEQTITIPADHRLILEIPPQIPAGTTARFELFWSPRKEAVNSLDATLEKIWALCKDSSVQIFTKEEVKGKR